MEEEKKASLNDLVVEAAYDLLKSHMGQGITRLRPLFPFCLVYILPRQEFLSGSIIIPDYEGPGAAAKITDEGIILQVWGEEKIIHVRRDGEEFDWTLKSEMHVGDHVMFPHWSGQPVPGTYVGNWSTSKFRFVKEFINTGSSVFLDAGGDSIIGKIADGVNVSDRVLKTVSEDELDATETTHKLVDRLIIFPRDVGPTSDRRL